MQGKWCREVYASGREEGRRKGKRVRTRESLVVEADRRLRDGEADVLNIEGMDDGTAMD